jgi:hypothetical protein
MVLIVESRCQLQGNDAQSRALQELGERDRPVSISLMRLVSSAIVEAPGLPGSEDKVLEFPKRELTVSPKE